MNAQPNNDITVYEMNSNLEKIKNDMKDIFQKYECNETAKTLIVKRLTESKSFEQIAKDMNKSYQTIINVSNFENNKKAYEELFDLLKATQIQDYITIINRVKVKAAIKAEQMIDNPATDEKIKADLVKHYTQQKEKIDLNIGQQGNEIDNW
jgi:flagellar basal body L-ring protein FlgH